MIQYSDYKLKPQEYIIALVLASSSLFIIGIIFFKSVIMGSFLALVGVMYPKMRAKVLQAKRVNELNLQFKQALFILASALAAGKSVETSFVETNRDLQHLYPDEQTYIRMEFNMMIKRLENGESIETILQDFSERATIEDIHSFTEVFIICKRTGGNLVEVMRNTANMIGEKIAIQQEIAVMVAQKKFESRVLTVTPVFFVAILSYTSADYMAPLYEGKGRIIMGCALILLVICYLISKKIMTIKV